MRVVDTRGLSDRERDRWRAVLDAPPVLADPDRPWFWWRVAGCVAVAAGLVTWTFGHDPFGGDARGVALDAALWIGVAAVCLTLAAIAIARRAQLGPDPFRRGRFLYPWGFAEVRPGSIVIVLGKEMEPPTVRVGPHVDSGTSNIEITLRAGAWTTTFRQRGIDLDVPSEALDALHRTELSLLQGYRDVERLPPSSDAVAPTTQGRRLVFGLLVAFIVGALPTGLVIAPERALAVAGGERNADLWRRTMRAFPLPWVSSRARAGCERRVATVEDDVAERVTEPLRTELLALLDEACGVDAPVVRSHGRCVPSRGDARRIDAFVAARAGTRGALEIANYGWSWDGPLFEEVASWIPSDIVQGGERDAQLVLDLSCRFEPMTIIEHDGNVHAGIETTATWRIASVGRPDIARTLVIPPLSGEDMAARDRAAPRAHRAPYADWMRATKEAIRRSIRGAGSR